MEKTIIVFEVSTGLQTQYFKAKSLPQAVKLAVNARIPPASILAGRFFVNSIVNRVSVNKLLTKLLAS